MGVAMTICWRFDGEVPPYTLYSPKPVAVAGADQVRLMAWAETAVATRFVAESAEVMKVCKLSVFESGELLLTKSNAWTW